MRDKSILYIELFLLFIALPLSLLLSYPSWIKLFLIVTGFAYIIFLLFKKLKTRFKISKSIVWPAFFKNVLVKLIVIAVVTWIYVYAIDASKLFCVPKSNTRLWVTILLVYSFLSVYPQEIIYRTFFFERYGSLFTDKRLLIFINAIIFSLAHIIFRNVLVSVLTFLGGLLFAYTYSKHKSTILVSMEHALYGNWLFTVGMGEMLAFPGMDAC